MNTYTFVKDQKKIILIPLKPTQIQKPKDFPQLDVFLTPLLMSQQYEFESILKLILLNLELETTYPSHYPSLIATSFVRV